MLELKQVNYLNIIRSVSAKLETGLVGVIGPNGAGKSTLLKLIAGVERPDSGEILLNGQAVHEMKSKERAKQLAYMPQQVPDDVIFSVREYVEMGRYAHRTGFGTLTAQCRQAVAAALRRMNLESLANTPLGQLSGGERQRVAIARCLAQGTSALVLDEPISSLDLHYQMSILNLLSQLAEEGYLIVMAIHHLELAAQYCGRLILLNDGCIYRMGGVEEVLQPEVVHDVFQIDAKVFKDPYHHSLRLSCATKV